MRNALSALSGPPPAPNPDPQPPTGGNALAGPGPQPSGAPPQSAPPIPTHQQTVAALRHFDAIEQELTKLLKDPDCGRADLRSKAIDGTTRLVAMNIMPAADAVAQLANFPDDPFEQKQWLEKNLVQTVSAANIVLQNHAHGAQQAAAAGQPMDETPYNADDHQSIMSGFHARYKGKRNG